MRTVVSPRPHHAAARSPAARVSRALVRLVLLAVLLALLVPAGTAAYVWWFARGDDRTRSDAILVLGAAQFDGRPSEVLEARLRQAQALYQQGIAPRIVTVGGGQEGDRVTEASAGQTWLVDHGIPSSAILPVGEGSNTLQSLEAAGTVFEQRGWESAVVVTDPWHAARSCAMAGSEGIEASSSPTRSGPSVRSRGTQVRYIARETAALLYWKIFGASSEAGPRAL